MSEQTGMVVEVEAPAKGESVYTIQMQRDAPEGMIEDSYTFADAWFDVATVKVPHRTHRKRLIAKALNDAGIVADPGKPAPRVRVLDEESAYIHEPEAKQPPAEWIV